jgi:mannose-1-phosphate guanylyltransferase
MQALILAGGEGTRLRPLTADVPKPVIPLAGRPFMSYMIEWLRRHGVDDVVMSCGFLADGVRAVLGDGAGLGVRLRYVEEDRPLGTAGAVKLAEPLLDERFLVLNGDVLTDVDLSGQLEQHERTGARVTLWLISVEDPSPYGLVPLAEDGTVLEFLEKPAPGRDRGANLINAGTYVVQREVLGLIEPGVTTSWERDVFPGLIGRGLYGRRADGYWLDIGTPERYLQATWDIIEGRVDTDTGRAMGDDGVGGAGAGDAGGALRAPALVGRACSIDAGAEVGPRAVLGDQVRVEAGSRVERSVLLDGVRVGAGCQLQDCIAAAGARLGEGARVPAGGIIGAGVSVPAGSEVPAGGRVSAAMTAAEAAEGA